MLDYGNEIMAACKAWIHENDLGRIRRGIFAPQRLCQSYGCHTGESMSTDLETPARRHPRSGPTARPTTPSSAKADSPPSSARWVR